jgi:outer membrane receptor for ferrienterochelin and colicins
MKYIHILFFLIISITEINAQNNAADLESLLNTKVSAVSKYWQSKSEAPATITIISSHDIEMYGFSSLAELLRIVTGFFMGDNSNADYFNVQNFSRPTDYMNRVLLLVNGHTINDNMYGGSYINGDLALSMKSIDRVEIVKGPGSVLYGSSAMIAIVNVITKEKNLLSSFNSSVEMGSLGRHQGSFNLSEKLFDGFDLFLSGKIGAVKGEQIDSVVSNAGSNPTNKTLTINSEKDRSIFLSMNYHGFTLNNFYSYRKKGAVNISNSNQHAGPFGNQPPPNQDNVTDGNTQDELGFTELKFNKDFSSNVNLLLRGYYDYNSFSQNWSENFIPVNKSQGNSYGFEMQFLLDLIENNRIIVGGEYKNNIKASFISGNGESINFSGDFPYNVYGVYLQDDYQILNNLSFSVGLRGDKYSNIGTIFTPRFALLYNPSNVSTIKLLYGEAYRAPNTYELYIQDPQRNYSGNSDLKSENIKTLELTIDQKIAKMFVGSLSLYNYRFSNVINSHYDSTSAVTQFTGQGNNVSANGIELGLNAKLPNEIESYLGYAYQYEKNEDPVNSYNSICHLIKYGFIIPIISNIYISSDMLYQSIKKSNQNNQNNSFFSANANLLVKNIFNHFDLSLKVNNITNINYYNYLAVLSQTQTSYYKTGRTFLLKLDYNF